MYIFKAHPKKKAVHVPVPVHFLKNKWVDGWKNGGVMCPSPSPKDQYITWMGVPHYTGRRRTGRLNG